MSVILVVFNCRARMIDNYFLLSLVFINNGKLLD